MGTTRKLINKPNKSYLQKFRKVESQNNFSLTIAIPKFKGLVILWPKVFLPLK